MAFCAYCGKELPTGAGYCPSCGRPVASTVVSAPATIGGVATPYTLAPTGVPSQTYGQTVARPNYASEADRIAAVIIDSIIIFIISLVLLIPLGLSGLFIRGFLFFGLDLLITWGFWILYFTYFESTTGQTLGKQLVHIRTVDETTFRPLHFPEAFIRNIFRIIDWLPFLYLIGIIVIAVDHQKRRLGDMVAHSIVIKT